MDQSRSLNINFKDLIPTMARHKWLVMWIMLLCIGGAVAVSMIMKKKWMATAQLVVNQRVPIMATTPESGIFTPIIETPDSQTALIMSDGMADRVLNWLRNDTLTSHLSREELGIDDPEDFRLHFDRVISVDVPKETNVVSVSAIGTSRDAARTLCNALIQSFVAWKKDMAQANVKDVTGSLEARVAHAKDQMDAAESAAAAYSRTHHIIDVTEQQRTVVDNYIARETDVQQAQQDLAGQEAKLAGLETRLKDEQTAIRQAGEVIRDDQGTQLLQQQLNALLIQRSDLKQKFTPDFPGDAKNPSLGELDAQINDVKGKIAAAVSNVLDRHQPSLQAQAQAFDDYKQQKVQVLFSQAHLAAATGVLDRIKKSTADFPQAAIEATRLQHNADATRALYEQLRADLNIVGTSKDMAPLNVQIAQTATVPEDPYRPSWLLNLVIGSALGIFLSVAMVLLQEQADRRVHDVEGARRLASGPIIGAIPPLKRRQIRQLIRAEGPSEAVEAYGVARANLGFALSDDPLIDSLENKVILVTSAVPGEGKSVTAAALARSLARAEKQVILVDADMRRPAQNMLFNTDEQQGLAEVLINALSLDDALVDSNTPNLSILYSGRADRNPGDLLALPRLGEVLSTLRTEADVVIVDAPASIAVADALYLSRHVDCILHVVGAGLAPEAAFIESAETLEAASHKPILFFVNRAPRGRGHAHRAYYAYNSRNGSGGGNGNGTGMKPNVAALTSDDIRLIK